MKTTRRIMTIALSLLLVSGNMAFAQNQKGLSSKKLTQKVERTVAKAAQKEKPLSVQYMGEIQREATKAENKDVLVGIGSAGGFIISMAGVMVSPLCGGATLIPGAMGMAGSTVGIFSTTDDFLPVEDIAILYPKIQQALEHDILDRFAVVLVYPPLMKDKNIKKALVEFLNHPRRNYPATKLSNGQYRFFFMRVSNQMYSQQVWVDIDAKSRLIFVRSESISTENRDRGYIIRGPKYSKL
jgi:hypothetical protein